MTDDEGHEKASMNLIITPDGFLIPDEAAAIHGITTAIAKASGVRINMALGLLFDMMACSDAWIAHNVDFDRFVVLSEALRKKPEFVFTSEDKWFCTMKSTTDICQIPGPYGFKWPKLQEVHVHAFGEEFSGVHDAMADVRACARVYFWLGKQSRLTEEPITTPTTTA